MAFTRSAGAAMGGERAAEPCIGGGLGRNTNLSMCGAGECCCREGSTAPPSATTLFFFSDAPECDISFHELWNGAPPANAKSSVLPAALEEAVEVLWAGTDLPKNACQASTSPVVCCAMLAFSARAASEAGGGGCFEYRLTSFTDMAILLPVWTVRVFKGM